MQTVQDERFYQLFQDMIDQMTDPENFSRQRFVGTLSQLAELLRLSKGITEFYQSEAKEKRGDGERLRDFDKGVPDHIIVSRRFVTQTGSVVKSAFYQADGEEPLSETDRKRADLCMRSILSFVSRNRLTNAVEALGFYDERGFSNIRSYLRCIERLHWQKKLGGAYTVMLCNLRHFALVNQDIGRKNADIVMHIFYNKLSVLAGDDGLVSRMGGDNFLAVFRNERTDKIIELLQGTPVCYDRAEDKRVLISASAGIYPLPEDFVFNSPGDIMDKLLASSQAAKSSEGGNILFFDQKMLNMKQRALRIQQLFPAAMQEHEFRVYYQPKVDVETGQILGAEALCRWFHDGVMVSPADFIPVLEQSTEICDLDFYMLDAVCTDIRRWLDEGRTPVRVSVNFSRKHLSDIDLLEHIMEIVEAHSIPHEYIEIELTETTTDVEFRKLKRVVSGLQQTGIYISVDDFGVGYSSLNLIREIPWNVLKIDRCFLPADGDSDASTTSMMFRHVVAMALDLGLECITEGVETAKQIEILRNNRCRIAQGFFFDRPLPVEQFETLLSDLRYDIEKMLG